MFDETLFWRKLKNGLMSKEKIVGIILQRILIFTAILCRLFFFKTDKDNFG